MEKCIGVWERYEKVCWGVEGGERKCWERCGEVYWDVSRRGVLEGVE